MLVRKFHLHYLLGCPVHFFRGNQVRQLREQPGFEILMFETVGKLFCVEAHPR
jgi:hypothetical protein